jgi:hypothetical protein
VTGAVVLSADDMTLVRELLADQERTLRLAAGITSVTTRAALYELSADKPAKLLRRLEFARNRPVAEVTP